MFAELKISGAETREYTAKEAEIIRKGDKDQAERLNAGKVKN